VSVSEHEYRFIIGRRRRHHTSLIWFAEKEKQLKSPH